MEYALVPIALAVAVLLVFAAPTVAASSPNSPTIKIVGQGIIWGGPNTWVTSTYHFGTDGPVFVTPGETVRLVDNTVDAHTLTLVTSSVEPHSGPAVDQCIGGVGVCGLGEALLPSGSNYAVGGVPQGTTYQCTTSGTACTLMTPYSSTTTPNGDEVLIAPGTTLYLVIAPSATPGTVIHFMCALHPWMQGEFIVA